MIPTKEEWFAALESRHGASLQKKLKNTTVAICGLGGLGSNIAISLARAGIGKLILIDYDHVDITNLHRQQYKATQIGQPKIEALSDNLSEIAPYVSLETHMIKLNEHNISQYINKADIICEAFDNPESKAMLTNYVLEHMPDKYLVAASGMAGLGTANTIKTKKISDKFYLCGDGVSDVSTEASLVSSRVMICAAHEAHTVIRIISELYEV